MHRLEAVGQLAAVDRERTRKHVEVLHGLGEVFVEGPGQLDGRPAGPGQPGPVLTKRGRSGRVRATNGSPGREETT